MFSIAYSCKRTVKSPMRSKSTSRVSYALLTSLLAFHTLACKIQFHIVPADTLSRYVTAPSTIAAGAYGVLPKPA